MLFKTQQEADEYFLEMERLANEVCDGQTAFELLAMIEVCYRNQEKWFIPAIVMSWEEMALSYIPENTVIKWVG